MTVQPARDPAGLPLPPGGGQGLISTLWFVHDNHEVFNAARRLYGSKIFYLDGLLFRDTPTVVVTDAAEVRRIFEDREEQFLPGYPPSVAALFPRGISAEIGATHRQVRATLRRPLSGPALAAAQPLFLELAERSLEACAAARPPFSWRRILRDLTFGFIARVALGAEGDRDIRWLSERWEKVAPIVFFPTRFDAMPWWTRPIRAALERRYREGMQARAEIRAHVEAAARRRAEEPRGDLLTGLLDVAPDGSRLAMDQVIDVALTLLFAGHETTVTALASFLFFLRRSPGWQRRLIEEQAALEAQGVPITMDGIRRMPLLTNAVKETLRWPPARVTFRVCERDVEIGGYRVPAGWIIATNIVGIHFDPEVWRDPLRWDPSRFEGEDPRRDEAYIPFGRGRRACIGEQPAMMELLSFGALLLRRMARGLSYELGAQGGRATRAHASPGRHRTNPLMVERFTAA